MRMDDVDLLLAVTIRNKSEPLRIRRPKRFLAGFPTTGQLIAVACRGVGDPDLLDKLILFPVRLLDQVRHVTSVGGNLRVRDRFRA